MMRGKMGWITKHVRSDCHRVKVYCRVWNYWFTERLLKGQQC